jgi:hypothetical protein
MAIALPAKRSKVDVFAEATQDARPERKLRGRKAPITLTLPPELIERVDAAASRHRRSRAQMMEIALEDWLATDEREAA